MFECYACQTFFDFDYAKCPKCKGEVGPAGKGPQDANQTPDQSPGRIIPNRFCQFESNEKWMSIVTQGFGDSGMPDEKVIENFWVSVNPNPPNDNNILVVTNFRVGLLSKKGMWSTGANLVFQLEDVIQIGIGESYHHEQQGFVSTEYLMATYTFYLENGQQWQRHRVLGTDQYSINQSRVSVQEGIQRLLSWNIPVTDGPGWDSSGGYSMGYYYRF